MWLLKTLFFKIKFCLGKTQFKKNWSLHGGFQLKIVRIFRCWPPPTKQPSSWQSSYWIYFRLVDARKVVLTVRFWIMTIQEASISSRHRLSRRCVAEWHTYTAKKSSLKNGFRFFSEDISKKVFVLIKWSICICFYKRERNVTQLTISFS